jgi:hypothetical protein
MQDVNTILCQILIQVFRQFTNHYHWKRKLMRRSRPMYRSLKTLALSRNWSRGRWEFKELNMPIIRCENDLTSGISSLRLRWWHSTLWSLSTLRRTETHWWRSHCTTIRWWSETGLIGRWSHLLLLLLLLISVHELTIWGHWSIDS